MTNLSRRTIQGAAGVLAAPSQAAPVDVAAVLQINDLARRIWQEELDEFVPKRMWEMHSHLGLDRFNLDPAKDKARSAMLNAAALEKAATMETPQKCNSLLHPGAP